MFFRESSTLFSHVHFASIQCFATGNTKEISCDFSASSDPDGYITNYKVKMGDGSEYNITNSAPIIHQYQSNGQYTVELEVTDDKGEETIYSTFIELINQLPVAEIYCSSFNVNELSCESHSYDNDGYIVNTTFDWGEGSQSGVETSFTTTLTSGGIKDVKVSVLDNEGASHELSISTLVTENQIPVVAFSCSSNSPGELNCTNSSYDPDGISLQSKWTIKESFYTSENVSLNLIPGEVVTVSLEIEDEFGAKQALVKNIQIMNAIANKAPIVNVNCLLISALNLSCTSYSTDPEGKDITHRYYVNDILLSQTSSFEYTFKESERGDNIIKIVVSDGELSSETEKVIHVNILPTAEIECEQPDSFKLLCRASNAIDDGTITDYSWIDGDGTFYNGESVEIPLQSYGTKKVSLTLTDNLGEMFTVEKDIQTYNYDLAPNASFTYYADLDFKVIFNATQALLDGRKVETYTWFVNDIQVKETDGPIYVHRFNEFGEYKIKLKIIDHNGMESSVENNIVVYDMEVPKVSYEDDSQTLEGIDSDGNGIRDDLQRVVNAYAKSNQEIKKVLSDFISLNQDLIQHYTDDLKLTELYTKQKIVKRCLASLVPEDHYKDLVGELVVLTYNTEERVMKWAAMRDALSDEVLNSELEETTEVCIY